MVRCPKMGDPARHVATFEELYQQIVRLPQHLTGEILEPGVIRTMSRPGSRHQFTSLRLRRSLDPFDLMESGRGWWFEIEREIRFGDKLAVPDMAGWKTADEPDFVEENPITAVPDWCCEILSPSTERDDRQLRLPLYARSGVAFTWLVDPTLRSVEVFETREQVPVPVHTAKNDDIAVLPPFEGRLEIGRYWKRARTKL